jgi:hypothetical protein
MNKNPYDTPTLILHGKVLTITQVDGTVQPTDVPRGAPGGAYPLS